MANYRFVPAGPMHAHTDWVTSIAFSKDRSDTIVTSSRDKSLIVWKLINKGFSGPIPYGDVHHRLTGHSHAVQDVVLSPDGQFALSGSSDGELRLWDLNTGTTARRFVGHTKEVLSVTFALGNRYIVSASSDNTVKIWNTLGDGECDITIELPIDDDYVPDSTLNSGALDNWITRVRLWNKTNNEPRSSLEGHNGPLKNVVSVDGSLGACGGKDGKVWLWDAKKETKLISMEPGSIIHALCFCPNKYWLCVATEAGIQIWDLERKSVILNLEVDLDWERDTYAYLSSAAKAQAFEEAELPKLKAKKPGLTHTQYQDMILDLWEKSPDNPQNQVNKSPKQLCEPTKVIVDVSLLLHLQQKHLKKSHICHVLQSENVKLCMTRCSMAELAIEHTNYTELGFDAIEECGHGDAEYSSVECSGKYVQDTDYVAGTASFSLYKKLNLLPIRFISFEHGRLWLKNYPQDVCYCTSLCWSTDGRTLFGGYMDGVVRVWEIFENLPYQVLPRRSVWA